MNAFKPAENTRSDSNGPPEPVGVPRRFGLSTLLILVAMYAGLFSVVQLLGANRIVLVSVGVFFTGIGLAQVFLFGGRMPRLASFVAGFVLGPPIAVVGFIIGHWMSVRGWTWVWGLPYDFIPFSLAMFFLGGPIGYVTGCFIASIFLVKRDNQDTTEEARQRTS